MCLTLGITKRTLQYYRNSGVIPYSFIGRKIYYKAEKVAETLAKGHVKSKSR